MKSLIDIVENLIIDESFQSSTLRDLIGTLNKTRYKDTEMLPHGIAWDKIPEDKVIYGESRDESFTKKYVKKDDYFVFWFPISNATIATRTTPGRVSRGRYIQGNTYRYEVTQGMMFITCGNEFIDYNTSKNVWTSRLEADCDLSSIVSLERSPKKDIYNNKKDDETESQYRKRIGHGIAPDFALTDKSRSYAPSVRNGEGPLGGKLTVKKLAEDTMCICVAISKETLAQYSTVELMQQRYDNKLNAVAMMRKDMDEYSRTGSWADRGKNIRVDFPTIRRRNIQRYKDILKNSKAIVTLKKYAEPCKKIVDAIDKYTTMIEKKRVTPESIAKLTGDQFIDVFFNKKEMTKNAKDIEIALSELQNRYNDIVYNLNYYVEGSLKGSNYADYKLEYIENDIESANKLIETLDYLAKNE